MSDAEARAEGVAEFRAYLEAQAHFLRSGYPEDADMSMAQYDVFSSFWAAIEAAKPVGLRAPHVVCGFKDEGGAVEIVSFDWSRGRIWFWFSVHSDGKCAVTYRNFDTDQETLGEWPSLPEALPHCLVVARKHFELTVGA